MRRYREEAPFPIATAVGALVVIVLYLIGLSLLVWTVVHFARKWW